MLCCWCILPFILAVGWCRFIKAPCPKTNSSLIHYIVSNNLWSYAGRLSMFYKGTVPQNEFIRSFYIALNGFSFSTSRLSMFYKGTLPQNNFILSLIFSLTLLFLKYLQVWVCFIKAPCPKTNPSCLCYVWGHSLLRVFFKGIICHTYYLFSNTFWVIYDTTHIYGKCNNNKNWVSFLSLLQEHVLYPDI